MNKGLIDEIGSPGFYNSSLYEYLPIFRADAEAMPALRARRAVGAAAVRRHHAGRPVDGASRLARPAGRIRHARRASRRCSAPPAGTRSNGHLVEYDWDEAAGEKAMAEALALIERAEQHPSGRLSGMVVAGADRHLHRGPAARLLRRGQGARPALADPCRPVGRRISRDHPPARLHADRLAGPSGPAVGPQSIIGHGIFLDDHPVHALAHRQRPAAAGGDGHDGRPLPDRVRPPRHHAEGFRPLPAGGREHGRRHRHLSAQHAG